MDNRGKKVVRLLIIAGFIIAILTFFITRQAETISINGKEITKAKVSQNELKKELVRLKLQYDSVAKYSEILRYRLNKIVAATNDAKLTKDSIMQIVETAQNELAEYKNSDEYQRMYLEKEQEALRWKSAFNEAQSGSNRWKNEYNKLEFSTRKMRRTYDSLLALNTKLVKENDNLLAQAKNNPSASEVQKLNQQIAEKENAIKEVNKQLETIKKEAKPAFGFKAYYYAKIMKKRFGKKQSVKRSADDPIASTDLTQLFASFDVNKDLFYTGRKERKIRFLIKNSKNNSVSEYSDIMKESETSYNKAIMNNTLLKPDNYILSIIDAETGASLLADYSFKVE